MRRQVECDLYNVLRDKCVGVNVFAQPGRIVIQQEASSLGLSEKEAFRFLEKWERNQWWEYGMWAWGGWFTSAAPDRLAP